MEQRLIMCREHPVVLFDYDRRTGHAAGVGTVLDRERLPLELITHGKEALFARQIDGWWTHRAIPSTRDGIRRVLDVMGVRSTVELLNKSLGLSLSDQYWVKPADSNIQWGQVNFFHNPFDEDLGRLLLTSYSSSHVFSFNAPDASTGGDLPKRWTIRPADGMRVLIKGGRTGQEPVNEVIASRLADRLGIPSVKYSLGEYDNRLVCSCAEMLGDSEELVSAWQLLGSVKRNNRLSMRDQWEHCSVMFGCDRESIRNATDDWLLVDYLMRNTDRHYNNFGVIRDVETMQVRPAPLFDTGASLWCGELHIDNRDYKTKPFYATYKTPTARRQLHLVSSWERYDLHALSDWPDEVAHRLSLTGMIGPARIDAICCTLRQRIEDVNRARDLSLGSEAKIEKKTKEIFFSSLNSRIQDLMTDPAKNKELGVSFRDKKR
ncbi:HipA domain-containing protein [Bifidobacterium biavatii]|uniref:Protein kinase n=1 Tax=Bifidobacterium biavatii DSM 23969 TaxID=1437608 RepID=A0A086Z5W8_9BIFI|nr:HipA domain-containing protein [Bifidobacterium biavatii]KFI41918.1 protein kinase [Bifidobacterium biavatii DSM 23969]